jgi:hypothetical protein
LAGRPPYLLTWPSRLQEKSGPDRCLDIRGKIYAFVKQQNHNL